MLQYNTVWYIYDIKQYKSASLENAPEVSGHVERNRNVFGFF